MRSTPRAIALVGSISESQQAPLREANWGGTVYHGMPPDPLHPGYEPQGYLAFLGRLTPVAIRIARQAKMPLRIPAKVPCDGSRYFREKIEPQLDEQVCFVGELKDPKKEQFLRVARHRSMPMPQTLTFLAYATSKGAIQNFTAGLAQLLAEKGIRVNSVAPGPVWTPLIPSTMPPDKVAHFGEQVPMKRPAQPRELAPVYVLLSQRRSQLHLRHDGRSHWRQADPLGGEHGGRSRRTQREFTAAGLILQAIQFSGRWVGFGEIARQEPDARAGDRHYAADLDAPETSMTGLLA